MSIKKVYVPTTETQVTVHIIEYPGTVGEPVPGAEVFLSQEPGDDPIAFVDITENDFKNRIKNGAKVRSYTFTKLVN